MVTLAPAASATKLAVTTLIVEATTAKIVKLALLEAEPETVIISPATNPAVTKLPL